MAEYIDKEAAVSLLLRERKTYRSTKEICAVANCAVAIKELIPAADVVEVRHGEWLVEAYPVDSDEVVIFPYKEHQHNDPFCSICGKHALLNGGEEYVVSNYCPNCGAKMDGKGGNNG